MQASKIMYTFFIKKYFFYLCFILSFIMLFNYSVDPYQYYRYSPAKNLQGDDRWQVAGFVKNFPYNQIILGTSMTQNFSLGQIKSLLKTNPIRLSLAGATIQEQATVLKAAIATKKVQSVIWGFDKDYLYYQKNVYPNSFPQHIYAGGYKAHMQYLLNGHVLKQSIRTCRRTILKTEVKKMTLENYNVWFREYIFSKEALLKQFEQGLNGKPYKPIRLTHSDIESIVADEEPINNFKSDILPIIQNNPNIHFIIFFPPYSLAQHKLSVMSKESKIKKLKLRDYLMQALSQCANVTLYDFETFLPIISNLNYYKDLTHYSEKINYFMIESFLTDICKVTKNNINYYQKQFLNLDQASFAE